MAGTVVSERLGLTQSGVSRAVARVEKETSDKTFTLDESRSA